jgi:Fe2+ or Zn2+ uptake regulation protein
MVEKSLPGVDHRQLRRMLQQAALKTSLPRLKVLEMLCLAALHGGGISSRLLHERLVEAGEPLSLVSVRQVLGRLVEGGLVVVQGGSRFCLAPAWRATISPQRPRNSSAA